MITLFKKEEKTSLPLARLPIYQLTVLLTTMLQFHLIFYFILSTDNTCIDKVLVST